MLNDERQAFQGLDWFFRIGTVLRIRFGFSGSERLVFQGSERAVFQGFSRIRLLSFLNNRNETEVVFHGFSRTRTVLRIRSGFSGRDWISGLGLFKG
jgi:hypothetical protein